MSRCTVITAVMAVLASVLVVLLVQGQTLWGAPRPLWGAPQPQCGTGGHSCLERPLCDAAEPSLHLRLQCSLRRAPLDTDSDDYRLYARRRLRLLLPEMVLGQYVVPGIIRAVERKLAHPQEPLVMHFAGDNGVGKTRAAEAVSLALAQRCGGPACTSGDTTLVLSGTAYDGLSISEFRKMTVRAIADHAQDHTRNGVVIINELTSLDSDKIKLLLPLLGRGGSFPEFPAVNLAALTVIITTDLGREGVTQGRSAAAIRAHIDAEFRQLYSNLAASSIRTFPFMPISLHVAEDIARATVREMGCDACGRPIHTTDKAASFLVEKVKPMLAVENGRAVAQQVAESVGAIDDLECASADATDACAVMELDLDSGAKLFLAPRAHTTADAQNA